MPSEKQYLERRENISAILAKLRTKGEMSRKELSVSLGLSWGCVSELSSMLISEGILIETSVQSGGRGRAPSMLRLNPDVCFLGVDVNKIGLNGAVCDLLSQKTASYSTALRCGSKDELVQSVVSFIKDILAAHKNICGIGFAMQGIYEKEIDTWFFPSQNENIEICFERDIIPQFNIPISVEHDPNCILNGCMSGVAGQKMIVRLDRGIGAAVCKDGVFFKDDPFELGYVTVNGNGDRLHDVINSDKVRSLSGKELEDYLEIAGHYLGVALGNVINLLCIDEIYICGDMITYYDSMKPSLTAAYEKTAISGRKAKLVPVNVTDAAYGAAKMSMEKFTL